MRLRASTWVFTGLLLLAALTPRAIYGWLFAMSHGPETPLYFDADCWVPTTQFVIWLIGCLALTVATTVAHGLLKPVGGELLRVAACRACGHGLMPEDLYCPACAGPTAAWDMPHVMLSARARTSTEQAQAAAPAVPVGVADAARFIVDRACPVSPDAAAALAALCLTDAVLLRRLYFTAALRLHPDRNNGNLHEDWQRLQRSVQLVRDHQRDVGQAWPAALAWGR